jgi:hypothetical protein
VNKKKPTGGSSNLTPPTVKGVRNLSMEEIIQEYPGLEDADILACITYADKI